MRRRDLSLTLALTAALCASHGYAQDAAVQGDASASAPGVVDPSTPLPPGHPGVGEAPENPQGGAGGEVLQRPTGPRPHVEERDELAVGTLVVEVLDARGRPVPEAPVHVGLMRGGEAGGGVDRRAGPDGVARFEGLETGRDFAYRVSTESSGARFSAPPFQLSTSRGARATVVRHDVTADPRGCLLWDARVELELRDERLHVTERVRVVNLTAMALGGTAPEPRAYLPAEGLRFALPRGYTAFQTEALMADVRVVQEGGAAVVRGAIPPTTEAPIDVVFQYQLRLDEAELDFESALPLPVVSATVIAEAPPGLTLSVDGMPAPESRDTPGGRILITGMERRPTDPALASVRVRLGGIPRAAGPMRTAAAAAAASLALGAVLFALGRARKGGGRRTLAEIDAEQARVLEEAEELARLKASGEVGPRTYGRRRRELALWLASLLMERDAVAKA